jgi:hypothetical protein
MILKIQAPYYPTIISLILVATSLSSCGQKFGKDKNQDSSTPELKLTPTEQLVGEWSGFYNAQDDGKIVGNGTATKVIFDDAGLFQLFLDQSKQIAVSGSWREFQGKTLFLSIKNSAVPRMGSSGDNIEASYNLMPSGLTISHSNFLIRIQKDQSVNTSHESGNWYSGSWVCDGDNGRTSKISMSDSGDFLISSVKGNERPFIASGKIQSPATSSENKWLLKLIPATYSQSLPTDAYFEFSQSSENVFPLVLKNSSKSKLVGNCHK